MKRLTGYVLFVMMTMGGWGEEVKSVQRTAPIEIDLEEIDLEERVRSASKIICREPKGSLVRWVIADVPCNMPNTRPERKSYCVDYGLIINNDTYVFPMFDIWDKNGGQISEYEYKEVVKYIKEKFEHEGLVGAQECMAFYLLTGSQKGSPKNYHQMKAKPEILSEALKYLKNSAMQGSYTSLNNLGYFYEQEAKEQEPLDKTKGSLTNNRLAFESYREAAEKLNEARINLWRCYSFGIGTNKDESSALQWLKKAAEDGYLIAQIDIARCYYQGIGTEKDYHEAVKWFKKASEQYDEGRLPPSDLFEELCAARFMIGVCYFQGNGVSINREEAFKWIKKSKYVRRKVFPIPQMQKDSVK
jgi:TPR repeat protein